jgi:putative tryptophan/tyrosine transport system substrate-binding protein
VRTVAQAGWSRACLLLLACAVVVPTPASAKVFLLTQSGGLYDTVTLGIVKRLPDKVEVSTLEKLSTPAELTAALLSAKPEAVVVVGVESARLVVKADTKLPLIFCLLPQGERDSLSGLNATGVALEVSLGAQLAAMRTILPNVKRLGVFYNPKVSRGLVGQARSAASKVGMILVEQQVDNVNQIADALDGVTGSIDAVWMLQDRTVGTALAFKVLLVGSLGSKLPLISYSASFVEGGALLSLAPDFDKTADAAVELTNKVVGGASPRTLPWQDGPGELVLNLKVASKLGISIAPAATVGAKVIR